MLYLHQHQKNTEHHMDRINGALVGKAETMIKTRKYNWRTFRFSLPLKYLSLKPRLTRFVFREVRFSLRLLYHLQIISRQPDFIDSGTARIWTRSKDSYCHYTLNRSFVTTPLIHDYFSLHDTSISWYANLIFDSNLSKERNEMGIVETKKGSAKLDGWAPMNIRHGEAAIALPNWIGCMLMHNW